MPMKRGNPAADLRDCAVPNFSLMDEFAIRTLGKLCPHGRQWLDVFHLAPRIDRLV